MKSYLKNTFQPDNIQHVAALDELPFWSSAFGHVLLDTVPMKQNMTVLDIGFGTGFPAIELAERLGKNCRTYGVDLSTTGLQRALEKSSIHGLKNINLLPGSAEHLPFHNESFDLIVSNNGLNNVQDFEKSLSECFRTSKKSGHLVFTINLPETMKEFYRIFESVLESHKLENEIQKVKQHIYEKRKPLDEVERWTKQAGFQIEKKIEKSFTYRFVDGSSMLQYFLIREFFLPSWKEIIPENYVLSVFGDIETRLNMLSQEKEELVLTIPFVCFDCVKPPGPHSVTLI